jgi:autotransporter-associated beta strand protein
VIDNSTVTAHSNSLTGTEAAAFRPPAAPTGPGPPSLSGSLTVNAPEATFRFTDGGAVMSGNLRAAGTRDTTFDIPAGSGPQVSVTGALTVQGGSGVLGLVVGGGSLTVGTDLTAKGEAPNEIQLTPGLTSKVGRNLSLTLGPTVARVRINANVEVAGNLTVNAGAGNNVVLLDVAGGPAGPTVGKNLSVTTQGGNDLVVLNQVTVKGTTTITTGAGADVLAIRGPSTFTGATTINLGAGDDNLAVANDTGSTTGPVIFTGTVNAQLGAGNDTLQLGLDSVSHGGNASTTVAFSTSTANKIDG